jgi:cytochrome c553
MRICSRWPSISPPSSRRFRRARRRSYLPRLPATSDDARSAPEIVSSGAPMRNIPSCAACHGGLDVKAGSPWLFGESANYLRAQLQAFADGTRPNDISQQMRNIARRMTTAEIEAAARYFSGAPD